MANWNATMDREIATRLRIAIEDEDAEGVLVELANAWKWIAQHFERTGRTDSYDYSIAQDYAKEAEDMLEDMRSCSDWYDADDVDSELAELYGFCDDLRIWIPTF